MTLTCYLCACFSALVGMLRESVTSGASGSPYQEMLMKCIWKVVRLLPEWLSQLDFHEIMLENHKFLEVGDARPTDRTLVGLR